MTKATTASQTPPLDSVPLQRLVRLLRPHKRDCAGMRAVRVGDWKTPWSGIPEETVWRSREGTKHGRSVPWLLIRCNDLDCPAQKLVLCDAVASIEPNAAHERPANNPND